MSSVDAATGMEARSPEIRPLCPQPRRPFALFETPSLPASPGPPEDYRLWESPDPRLVASSRPPSRGGVPDLYEALGLGEKKEICEHANDLYRRPLSSQSTSAGPTPSPDEAASLWQQMSFRSVSPFSEGIGAPGLSIPDSAQGLGLASEWPHMSYSPSPDDLPMTVRPSSRYGSPCDLGWVAGDLQTTQQPLAQQLAQPLAQPPAPPWPQLMQPQSDSGGLGLARTPTPQQQRKQLQPRLQQGCRLGVRAAPPGLSPPGHAGATAEREREGQFTKEQVVQMSKTQAGSKLLQRKLLKGHPTVIKEILEGIEMELPEIMCNMYGNYLCSASFQACSVAQRLRMLEIMSKNLHTVATDKWGTHALQALISLLCTPEEQDLLMPSLRDHFVELSCDPNGAHVVQRALISFGTPCPELLLQEVVRCLRVVAHSPSGLCVLKKCISQSRCGSSQQLLLKELVSHALDLVQSPFGNYAIQHALEEWGGEACRPIVRALQGRLVQLSIQKFSSNVVEHTLMHAPADVREQLIEELACPDQARLLMSSVYGHYVAFRLLQAVPPERRIALERLLSAGLVGSRSQRLREKWENVLSGKDKLQCEEPTQELPSSGSVEGRRSPQMCAVSQSVPCPEMCNAAGRRRGPRGRRGGGGSAALAASSPVVAPQAGCCLGGGGESCASRSGCARTAALLGAASRVVPPGLVSPGCQSGPGAAICHSVGGEGCIGPCHSGASLPLPR